MFSRLQRRVIQTATFLHGIRRSLPYTFQSYFSVHKYFGTNAARFESQAILNLRSATSHTSHTRHELDLRNADDLPSKFPRSSFHIVYLRDSCTCSRCIDPSTNQKLFDTADIPDNIQGNACRKNSDGSVTVAWQNDIPGYESHRSTYSDRFITSSFTLPSRLSASHNRKQERVLWDQETMATHSTPTDYKAFIESTNALYHALVALQKYGLIFLCNVPSRPDAINHIANRVGLIRNTIYGSTWDVRPVPSAKNVAYTAYHLGFHMDLLYLADPPELQILHCLGASKQGGESLFSDTLRAVETMGRQCNPLLESLMEFPITYWYKNDGFNFQHTKRTIEMKSPLDDYTRRADSFSQVANTVKAVNWSPPFQAPLLFDIGDNESHSRAGNSLSNYLESIKAFKKLIEDPASVFETKLEEGTCVIFNNRRIVHARRAFSDKEGNRWLRGAYVDRDACKSRLRILEEERSMAVGVSQ